MSGSTRTARARLAARTRHSPDDTDAIEAARADLAAAGLADHIQAVVDSAPPLTAEQRDRLATLLRPSTQRDGGEHGA